MNDLISRQALIEHLRRTIEASSNDGDYNEGFNDGMDFAACFAGTLPSAQPDAEKYEYHYDHTDCIWYRPEAKNRCPVTCAQYRDGWNDAMNYIFRDGKGYRPFKRGMQYDE